MTQLQAKNLFIDFSGREQVVYSFFLEEMKKNNNDFSYISFDQSFCLEQENVAQASACAYAFSPETLRIEGSPLIENMQVLLSSHQNHVNKTLIFLLPAGINALYIIGLLRLITGKEYSLSDEIVRSLSLFFANSPDSSPVNYHTALRLPSRRGVKELLLKELLQNNLKESTVCDYMPRVSQSCTKKFPWVTGLFPVGCYVYDNRSKNHLFFLNKNYYMMLSFTENFHSAPLESTKKALYKNLYRSVIETIASCISTGIYSQKELTPEALSNKKDEQIINKNITKKLKEKKEEPVSAAWMELVAFEPYRSRDVLSQEEEMREKLFYEERQRGLVNDIFDAHLDILWLSITPNIYFSPIARMIKKDNTQESIKNLNRFYESVSRFTLLLREKSNKLKKPVPKIVIGFEIANNLYPPHLPRDCALDCFGNKFEDLPAPLNRHFWYNEFLRPLAQFVRLWQKEEISHGLALSGVMIDGEMYCRKKTGLFSAFMGFEKSTLMRFASLYSHEELKKILRSKNYKSCHEAVRYLRDKKLLTYYWDYLHDQASLLGNLLREKIELLIPGALCMTYLPALQAEWFYDGLLRGLSSKSTAENNFFLLTFNAGYQEYIPWLRRYNNLKHLSVFMLSKAQSIQDAELVKGIFAEHDGVWYNRFSRFAEPYNGQSWTAIEQSPLDHKEKKRFFKAVYRTVK